MGNHLTTRVTDTFWPPQQYKILLVGLDGSGKTTFLYRVATGEVVTTTPTSGFNVETIRLNNIGKTASIVTAWDLGGRDKSRPLMYRHYSKHAHGLVWLVDSADPDRFEQARHELHQLLDDEHLIPKKVPCLILCNKQDLPGAMSIDEVAGRLEVSKYADRRIEVMGISTTQGTGIPASLAWLEKAMAEQDKEDTLPHKGKEEVQQPPPLAYDPRAKNPTLERFKPIQEGTNCPFAKAAKLWGGVSPSRDDTNNRVESLEDQARANAIPLWHFCKRVRQGDALDGFCIELQDERLGGANGGRQNPKDFGACVFQFLTALSDTDPNKEFSMRVSYIGARGWQFRFLGVDLFITTFASCYPATHSRYAFGTGRAFCLFQPHESFLRHDLPDDTPHTDWDNPQTIRDKTRVAFRAAGRPYYIPDSVSYPPAEHIVKPLKDDGSSVLQWWEPDTKKGDISSKQSSSALLTQPQ